MALETVFGLSFLAMAIIGYAVSRLPKSNRMKFVDQKVKDRGETDYAFILYI